MDKRDRSMVTPVLIDQHSNPECGSTRIVKPFFKFKTKKSFDTPEAALADHLARDVSYNRWIFQLLQGGLTPTFEITSPKFPIVLLYKKDELTLLHIRENESGRYLTEQEIKFLNPPMQMVQNIISAFRTLGAPHLNWETFRIAAERTEGVEGWIIQFENGEMVKVKTKWYINLHHSVTFTRWRDVARTVLADQADDLKGAFVMTGRSIAPIEYVSQQIKHELFQIQMAVELSANSGRAENLSVKDMALRFNGVELFGLIMREFRDQEINWNEYYERHLLDSWSLQVIPSDGTINEQDARLHPNLV
jgi:T4 RnlA family RNA ligase